MQYYTVYIIEIDLEIDIFLDSKSELKIFEISLRNVLEFQRFLFVPVKSTNFNLKLTDLKPSEIYTLKLFGCNNAGCASGQFEKIETNDSIISGFESLAVFVVGQNRVEIEFEDPTETNGAVTMFRIYRNEFVIAEFDPSSPSLLKKELGFYSFTDSGLKTSFFYDYKIQAINKVSSCFTNKTLISSLAEIFYTQCGNVSSLVISSIHQQFLILLNSVTFEFTANISRSIWLLYVVSEWRRFITCFSSKGEKQFTFAIRVFIRSRISGLQAVAFPYPEPNDFGRIAFPITVLQPFTNYSLRIGFLIFNYLII